MLTHFKVSLNLKILIHFRRYPPEALILLRGMAESGWPLGLFTNDPCVETVRISSSGSRGKSSLPNHNGSHPMKTYLRKTMPEYAPEDGSNHVRRVCCLFRKAF